MKKHLFYLGVFALILTPAVSLALPKDNAGRRGPSLNSTDSAITDTATIHFAQRGPRKEILREHINRVIARYQFFLTQLDKLIDRVEALLNKIEAKGQERNVADVRAKLNEAKTAWETANQQVAALQTKLETAFQSSDPKEAMKDIRQAAKEAKDALKAVHQKIVEAIKLLKALRGAAGPIAPISTQP